MGVFPDGHVCPLAVVRNESRCFDPAGKPDTTCGACRAALVDELGDAMLQGDASFFEMLFVGHVLEREGFIGTMDEDGGIQLERARGELGELGERPGDCVIGALSPVLGGGYRLFIAIDDDHEIVEVFDSLKDAVSGYFSHKDTIEELATDGRFEG